MVIKDYKRATPQTFYRRHLLTVACVSIFFGGVLVGAAVTAWQAPHIAELTSKARSHNWITQMDGTPCRVDKDGQVTWCDKRNHW